MGPHTGPDGALDFGAGAGLSRPTRALAPAHTSGIHDTSLSALKHEDMTALELADGTGHWGPLAGDGRPEGGAATPYLTGADRILAVAWGGDELRLAAAAWAALAEDATRGGGHKEQQDISRTAKLASNCWTAGLDGFLIYWDFATAELVRKIKVNAPVHSMVVWRGLLLYGADTEGFYREVQERILARYGKAFDWSLKAKMMGKKAAESACIFVDECGLVGLLTPEQFLEEREGMLQELFPSCIVLPGLFLPF
ncbi:hypothetical protein ZWY2020_054877 [Hordeum vulgare]|nr:hypothetical protein ZWY2020_054877 [Hordeum vulgare]